ncbi:MAG: hypothetical protein JNL38_10820, partial [Myxococcales bacterium]|jgi:hypothetical protein|nr:hypothetical protein [Myxococcales bacterium]
MLTPEWLKAIVPIGDRTPTGFMAKGTAVAVRVGELTWLVTAAHVVASGQPLIGIIESPRGEAIGELSLGKPGTISWVVNHQLGIAAHPFQHAAETSLRVLTPEDCLPLALVVPSAPAYTIGVPTGIEGLDPKPTPFVMGGIVSAVANTSASIYSTAVALPGTAGCPLVVERSGGRCALAGLMFALTGFQQSSPNTQLFFGVARSMDPVLHALAHMRLGPPRGPGGAAPPQSPGGSSPPPPSGPGKSDLN